MPIPLSAVDYQNVGEHFNFFPVSIGNYQQSYQQQYQSGTTAGNPGNRNTAQYQSYQQSFQQHQYQKGENVENPGIANISPHQSYHQQQKGTAAAGHPVNSNITAQYQSYHETFQQHQDQKVKIAENPENSDPSQQYSKRKFAHNEIIDKFDPHPCLVSHTLTPPQTPVGQMYQGSKYAATCLDTSYPEYQHVISLQDEKNYGHVSKRRRILTQHPQHYVQMVSVNGVGFQIKYQSDLDSSNSNSKNINNPGISFLYEKSLNNAQRWRENGLTVQLFYCIVCQFQCDDDERMKSHIECIHGGIVAGGHLHCNPCNQIFYSEDTFLKHSASHYQSSTDCKGCGKGFTSQESLKEHTEHCHESRPHVCEYCDRRFLLSARLKHHRRNCSQAPEPSKFVCKVCNKHFKYHDKYVEHVPIHAFM